VSQLALYNQFNLRAPLKVSDDHAIQVAELAEDGIYFAQHDILTMLPNTSPTGDQLLKLYEELVENVKREHNYLYADIARIHEDDVHGVVLRSQYISEHTHNEDEARFFIEGAVLVYIHVQEKIHILQCGAGDLLIIPKKVKHWMDIGPQPHFTAIRWYNTRGGLQTEFTGSYVAESTPRWETIYNDSNSKR
jgi:1,2-dihydroxy-3-keto-5-methylthiopentene dioxygenase